MKIDIYKEEWWPVWEIEVLKGPEVKERKAFVRGYNSTHYVADEEVVKRWQKAFDDFHKVQDEMFEFMRKYDEVKP